MAFKLSNRSTDNLIGVNPDLVKVVKRAIELTDLDFGVIEGVRTEERQVELVQQGASQTMKSKHLTGDAVDLLAYIGARGSWEIYIYPRIADAMKEAGTELGVKIRWGGAWHIGDITHNVWDSEAMMDDYIDYCAMQGRKPFIDAVHFELIK
jgi:peptidoglycan L-alanyl-D-glutamate endopeptidase CwlK